MHTRSVHPYTCNHTRCSGTLTPAVEVWGAGRLYFPKSTLSSHRDNPNPLACGASRIYAMLDLALCHRCDVLRAGRCADDSTYYGKLTLWTVDSAPESTFPLRLSFVCITTTHPRVLRPFFELSFAPHRATEGQQEIWSLGDKFDSETPELGLATTTRCSFALGKGYNVPRLRQPHHINA